MSELSDRAIGRWRSLLPACGVPSQFLTSKHGPCPFCGNGVDRFMFTNHKDTGGFICHQCGHGNGFEFLMRWHKIDFPAAAKMVEEVIGKCERDKVQRRHPSDKSKMERLWRSGEAVGPSGIVDGYLHSRGIQIAFPAPLIRFVAHHDYWAHADVGKIVKIGTYPAMICKIAGPDGKCINIHRTYLTDEVPARKKLHFAELPPGSYIPFFKAAEEMGVSTGIETTLSASILYGGMPVWSLINDGNLIKFKPPSIVKKLWIFGDNDISFSGQQAAFSLAKALKCHDSTRHIEVVPIFPLEPGKDYNDILRERQDYQGAMGRIVETSAQSVELNCMTNCGSDDMMPFGIRGMTEVGEII